MLNLLKKSEVSYENLKKMKTVAVRDGLTCSVIFDNNIIKSGLPRKMGVWSALGA